MAIYYLDYVNGTTSNDTNEATPLGWWKQGFTNGNSNPPAIGARVQGVVTAASAYVTAVVVNSGAWNMGTAAGTFYYYGKSGTFNSSETITYSGGLAATVADATYCAWKTLTNGATAARIAPGDIIRIAKSPAPYRLGWASWRDGGTAKKVVFSGTIASSAATNPAQIYTDYPHGFQTGDVVTIAGHSNGSLNGTFAITYIDTNIFSIPVAAGGSGSGGSVYPAYKVVDQCETAWTGANSASVARINASPGPKEGSYCMKIQMPGSGTTTGTKYAYYTITSADFSKFQKLTFWIYNNQAMTSSDYFRLALCSDTLGATKRDEFIIPALPAAQRWVPLTITRNGGGDCWNGVQSIALWSGTNAPTNSWWIALDNIVATTTNGINLQTLISKNSSEQISTSGELWYPIQSIEPTGQGSGSVYIDQDSQALAGVTTLRGYYGTIESCLSYGRETIKTDMVATSTAAVQTIQDSGANLTITSSTNTNPITITSTAHGLTTGSWIKVLVHVGNVTANGDWTVTVTGADTFTIPVAGVATGGNTGAIRAYIKFEGGYDPTTNLQSGETYYDGLNAYGRGISNGNAVTTFNRINPVRYYDGFYCTTTYQRMFSSEAIGCSQYGFNLTSTGYSSHDFLAAHNCAYGVYHYGNWIWCGIISANCNTSTGVTLDSCLAGRVDTVTACQNNNGLNLSSSNNCLVGTVTASANNIGVNFSSSTYITINSVTANSNNNGVNFSSSSNNYIWSGSAAGSAVCDVSCDVGYQYFNNFTMGSGTEVASNFTSFRDGRVHSNNHDNTVGNHWIWVYQGTINSQVGVTHSTGIAWRFLPSYGDRQVYVIKENPNPLNMVIARVACYANKPVTARAWMKFDDATASGGKLCVRANRASGIVADVYSAEHGQNTNWEQLTLTFTPTQLCVVEIEVWAWSIANPPNYVYIDDVSVTQ